MGGIDRSRLLDWARRIARTPSQQTDRFEAEPEVQAFQRDCIAPILAEAGLAARFDAMGNVIVEIGPRDAARSLLLMGYAMTHPAAAMRDPFAGEVVDTPEGPALRGRGVAEQKGSLAAAIAAVAAWARAPAADARLVFCVSTAGETGRHDAAQSILAAIGPVPPLGIVVLGTGGKVALGNKGRIDVEVIVRGRAAHSSTPWAGVNAIEGLRLVLEQLPRVPLPARAHPALGQATLTPTFIETWPRATHTVQAGARLTLDRRLLPGDDPDIAFRELRAALSLPEPFGLEVTRGAYMYPCEIAPDGALMRAIMAGAAAAGLPPPETWHSHGALDAGYLLAQGCEAAMWGPGAPEQWHSDNEQVPVAALEDGARRYLGLLRAALA
jgi:acetylornithine deacetylase